MQYSEIFLTTVNNTRHDKNRKRTIETINNSSKVAKVVIEERLNGSILAYGRSEVALALAPPSLPAPQLQQPPRKEEGEASSARENCEDECPSLSITNNSDKKTEWTTQ